MIERFLDRNVVFVNPDGRKVKGGQVTSIPCITVGVVKKLPKEQLTVENLVPSEMDGQLTDVIEVERITAPPPALAVPKALTDHRIDHRPTIPGGVSCGHYQVTAGTTTGVFYKDGKPLMGSNNHVLANGNFCKVGDPLLQRGTYDGGKMPDQHVWDLAHYLPLKYYGQGEFILTFPVGGEVLYVGDTVDITWVSELPGNVRIEISLDGRWYTLASELPMDAGIYHWTIKNQASDKCKIKLVPLDFPQEVESGEFAIKSSPWSGCKTSNVMADGFNFIARKLRKKTRMLAVVPQPPIYIIQSPISADIFNTVDFALGKYLDESMVSNEILEIGEWHGMAEGEIGMPGQKSGRTTGVTIGEIDGVNVEARVGYSHGDCLFRDLISTPKILEGGDSGSPFLTMDKRMIGVAFAGSPYVSLFIKIQNIIKEFGLDPL